VSDALLEGIRADPDDDAPRLVWADREGGERGELVVLQIALASGRLARADRHRMRARERELLQKNGRRWSNLHDLAEATFVRGFVERVTVKLPIFATEAKEIFARAPLATDFELRETSGSVNRFSGPLAHEAWAELAAAIARSFAAIGSPDRVRFLSASPVVYESGDWADTGAVHRFDNELVDLVARTPELVGVRSLAVYDGSVDRDAFPHLQKLPRLGRLQIASALDGAGAAELLRTLPTLERLSLWGARDVRLVGRELERFLAAPELARLTELELHSQSPGDADLELLARSPRLTRLRRLGLGFMRAGSAGVAALAASPHLLDLEELELIGAPLRDADIEVLARATFAPRLRKLGLAYAGLTPAIARTLLTGFPTLEELDVSQCAKLAPALAELSAQIPEVRPTP
jgi:uncharacterized protein (TIGR02996 family)